MMKKLFAYLAAGALFIGSCTENELSEELDNSLSSDVTTRVCASMDVLEAQLAADPKLHLRLESIESHTRDVIASGRLNKRGQIEIPVVVNVIYRTSAENISNMQIRSQIDVLNEDFNATNKDVSRTPSLFARSVADIDVRFVLVRINRKYSNKRSWGINDAMKYSSRGGIDASNPGENLNMWIVNKITSGGGTMLGYAQFPGGNPATDGVVIGHNFFGRVGRVSAPFDKGRTATHEVGHWMNLRHIWGDATCGTDYVGDTPQHNTYNVGCPSYPNRSTCAGRPVEMTMNYMDYTDDACMFMFTKGQKNRIGSTFIEGGPRASFAD
jgi:hypothetical protein